MNTLLVIFSIIAAIVSLANSKKSKKSTNESRAVFPRDSVGDSGSYAQKSSRQGINVKSNSSFDGEFVSVNRGCVSENAVTDTVNSVENIGKDFVDESICSEGDIGYEYADYAMDEVYDLIACGYTVNYGDWRDFTREGEDFLAKVNGLNSFSANKVLTNYYG